MDADAGASRTAVLVCHGRAAAHGRLQLEVRHRRSLRDGRILVADLN